MMAICELEDFFFLPVSNTHFFSTLQSMAVCLLSCLDWGMLFFVSRISDIFVRGSFVLTLVS